MGTVRSIIFHGAWALWTALFGLAIPVLWLSGSPPKLVRTFARVWARGILTMLSGIVGLKYVIWHGGYAPLTPSLFISNHQSMWETLAALVLFPDVAIVAKCELLRIPVMGWYLRRSPMILIDRDAAANALRQMVEQSRAAVAARRSVLIFLEGTRKRVGAPIEFKRGVEFLYRMRARDPHGRKLWFVLGDWRLPAAAGRYHRGVLGTRRSRTESAGFHQNDHLSDGVRESHH